MDDAPTGRNASYPRPRVAPSSIKNLIYCVFILAAALAIFRVRVLDRWPRPNVDDAVRYCRVTATDFTQRAGHLAKVAADGADSSDYKACVALVQTAWCEREAAWYSARAEALAAGGDFDFAANREILHNHQREAGLSLIREVAARCDPSEF